MAQLKDLMRDLGRALQADDHSTAASVRETISAGHPGTPQAAEAGFKLGLYRLFKERNLDQAALSFRAAAKAKHPVWSPQARMALGQILGRQGKVQQAVFELRRVAGMTPPTVITAQAAGLVVLVLREAGNGAEADRARGPQLDILGRLCKNSQGQDLALAQHMLALEHKYDGRRDLAKPLLQQALTSGDLPPAQVAQVEQVLKEL